MPADFWTEARQMVTSGAIVAAVALPAGLAAWVVARRRTQPLLPACKPWRVPWTGFELFAAFVVLNLVVSTLVSMALEQSRFYQAVYGPDFPREATQPKPSSGASASVAGYPAVVAAQTAEETRTQLRRLWASALALPIQLGLVFAASRFLYPRWRPLGTGGILSALALAVLAWIVLTPLVLLFHAGVLQVFTALNWAAEDHPLTHFRDAGELAQVLFLLQACVAAPLMEELIFRGLLLPWVIGARERSAAAPPLLVPPTFRPWVVMGIAMLFAANTGKLGPLIFVGVLAGGLAVVWVAVRRGKRHVRGVYATAAFFAAVHSGVWPSPVPLFLLALGLGWLAVRTRGVLVPFVVHGLFNAVSAVYVLCRGAG